MKRVLAGLVALAHTLALAAPLAVQPLQRAGDDAAWRLPFVSGGEAAVARRINALVTIDLLRVLPPARAAQGLPKPDDDTRRSLPEADFRVLRQDARVLALAIDAEGCGAYCEGFSHHYAFDLRSGRRLMPDDLISAEGRVALNRAMALRKRAVIQRHLQRLQRQQRSGAPADDDSDAALAMYQECLPPQAGDGRDRLDYPELLQVGRGFLEVTEGRCSNHAMRALDELDDFHHRFAGAQLAPWLTPYGRALVLGQGDAAAPAAPWGQVFRGLIDGRLPITMYLPAPGGGVYFYDRQRQPIELDARAEGDDGLRIEERTDDGQPRARFELRREGPGWAGHWQATDGRRLPVTLGP